MEAIKFNFKNIVCYTQGSSLSANLIDSNAPHVLKLFNQVVSHPTLLPSYACVIINFQAKR